MNNLNFYPEDRFASCEEYINYLKENNLAFEAPQFTTSTMSSMTKKEKFEYEKKQKQVLRSTKKESPAHPQALWN